MLVASKTPAARNRIATAAQPRTLVRRLFLRLPMIFRLFATSMIMISSGGATKPFTTAVKNKASIGLMPR